MLAVAPVSNGTDRINAKIMAAGSDKLSLIDAKSGRVVHRISRRGKNTIGADFLRNGRIVLAGDVVAIIKSPHVGRINLSYVWR